MRKINFLTICITILLLLSTASYGQKVNFSGDWKLNMDKSELGMAAGQIVGVTMKVEHKDADLKLNQTVNTTMAGEQVQDMSFIIDGKEQKTTDPQGNEFIYTGKWVEKVVVVEAEAESAMGPTSIKLEFSLSEDKKILNMTQNVNNGAMVLKLVFDKYTPKEEKK